MQGPLTGMRVLDLTQYVAGPFCTMLLGDMGAEVIKIELPGRGDIYRIQGPHFIKGEATSFLSVNRNKKSLTLNLKDPRGLAIANELVTKVDVLVENFKPGTAKRLGLGYEELTSVNPKLVYCSISGYGQTGPERQRGGYDLMAQARSGLMSITGTRDGPPAKAGVAIVDMGAAMYAALSILSAYIVRERTGKGQRIDVALLDTAVSWCTMQVLEFQATGEVPSRMGSASPFFSPYQAFKAQDGYLCVVGTGGKDHWERFCHALGHSEWAEDPRFIDNANRVAHLDKLAVMIEAVLARAPVEVWVQRLEAHGLPCEPVRTLDQMVIDPQVQARDMVVQVDHPTAGRLDMVGVPFKLSKTPAGVWDPPPAMGQHTDQVLRELGYTERDIDALRGEGVI